MSENLIIGDLRAGRAAESTTKPAVTAVGTESAPAANQSRSPGRSSSGSKTRVAFLTLGCKLNQHESDALAARFSAAGYEIGDSDLDADVVVVNTCTVTDRADRKSRNISNRSRRRLVDGSPARLVVLTGCFVSGNIDRLQREALEDDGRTLVVGNDAKSGIFNLVDAYLKGEIAGATGEDHPSKDAENAEGAIDSGKAPHKRRELFAYRGLDHTVHTRGSVKIQDGCDNFCSFCIIPFVRGRAQSRPADEILQDIAAQVASGSREIVLTGVNMSRWAPAPDTTEGPRNFTELLRAILDLNTSSEFRLRLSSVEPEGLGPDFASLFSHQRMCPSIHLCLQSGSERVLLAMRRQYSRRSFATLVAELRRVRPDISISTDMIVGFPGESDEDFQQSFDAAREFAFSKIHVFPYSLRSGTRAERMPGQVSHRERDRRVAIMKALDAELCKSWRARFTGQEQTIIIESGEKPATAARDAGKVVLSGWGEHYVPVSLIADPAERGEGFRNRLLRVRLDEMSAGDEPVLVGRSYRDLTHKAATH